MTYTPPVGFPTPQLLSQAQKDYDACQKVRDRPLDMDGVPIPFPCTKSKTKMYWREKYRHVDEMAMSVSMTTLYF